MSIKIIMKSSIKKNIESLQRITPNPKFVEGMDELISLYKSRRIENVRTAFKIADKLSATGKGSVGAGNAGMKMLAKYRTKESATGKLDRQAAKQAAKMKTKKYFVKGKVQIDTRYKQTNSKTKVQTLSAQVYHDTVVDQATVMATDQEDAIKQFTMMAMSKFANEMNSEDSSNYKVSDVKGIKVDFVEDEGSFTAKSEANTPMRDAKPVKYGFIPSDGKYDKNEGFCVFDVIEGIYSPLKKKMTREWLINKVGEKMGLVENPLDYGMDMTGYDPKDGVTPSCLMDILKEEDISMYAYDITNNCFLKTVSHSRHYPALVFYAVGGHMYWISDKKKAESLIKKAYDRETKIKSVVFQEEYESEAKNLFDGKTFYKDVPIADLANYKESVVVIGKKHLNDELLEYIKIYNTIPDKMKNNKVMITQFYDTLHDITLTIDPNDTRLMNFERVKEICNDKSIEFTNQPFTAVIKQMREKFMQTERAHFSKEFRTEIFEAQGGKCQMCKETLKKSCFHIDHIQALANGGTNEIDNLQILCKPCHFVKSKDEKEDGYVKVSETESSFNSETSKVFESDLARAWAFVERLEPIRETDTRKLYGLDINKCRKNCMYYNKFNYPLFSVMDKVRPYKGNHTKTGLYYVETKKYFPLRGNGWYSHAMIQYCLDQSLISDENIKHVMYSSLEVKHDYFNKLIDHYYKELNQYNTDDFKFDKFAVNTMIGQFKPKERENWKSICITQEAGNAFGHYLAKSGCFIDCLNIDDKNYYNIFDKYTLSQEETEAPIYNMVLELEAIELHKLSTLIKNKGGEVLDLVTDCITCSFPDDVLPFELDGINIVGHEFAPGVPKYKLEAKEDRLQIQRKEQYIRTDVFHKQKYEWNKISDSNDNNFEPFVNKILDDKMSINIDGRGGTGKSTLIGQLQNEMEKRELKYVSLAPSNKSARVIKGQTIHKFIKSHPSKIMRELNLDYIIIDEISMVSECFYKYFLVLKRLKPALKFIIAGHFDQLLPVNDRANFDYKGSVALHDLCNGNRLELTKCRRSDDICFNKCSPDNVPNLTPQDFGNAFTKRHISYTNKTRIAINELMMKEFVKQKKSKNPVRLNKLSYDKNSQDVKLLSGMPIIARINDKALEIYNNETFTIKEIQHTKRNILIVDEEGESKDIHFDMFQKLFYVAFCITIHKSQGSTFDHPYTIHDWDHPSFDNRLKYVALSRTTKLENINVI